MAGIGARVDRSRVEPRQPASVAQAYTSFGMRTGWIVTASLMLLGSACGGEQAAEPPTAPSSSPSSQAATSRFPALERADLLAMSEPVRMHGDGGVRLEGRLFGSGDVGVALAHMGGGDQSQWFGLAGHLYGGVTVSEQTRGLRIPTLFMAGEVDGEAGDLLRVFEETAPEPKEVVTLDTGEHGTDILAYADVAVADESRQAVLDFLTRI